MTPPPAPRITLRRILQGSRGQTLAEVGIVLPLLIFLAVGTLHFGWGLYQSHVVRKIARESANMISRQVTFAATEAAVQAMPVFPGGTFDANAKLILSVLQQGTGSNAGHTVIVQRHSVGGLSGTSILGNPSSGAFGPSPHYNALNPATDTSIRVSSLPNGLSVAAGQSVYVAELYTRRSNMASMSFWGIAFPTTLYASSFF